MVTWLLSLIGEDRPEALQKLVEAFALLEGHLLDSQQSVMDGRLVALLKVSLPAEHTAFALQALGRLESQGLSVVSLEELPADHYDQGKRLTLEVSGEFRIGIDHDIRLILESHGACIDQLNQHYVGEPCFGERQFSAHIRANLTRPISEARLLQALHRLAPGLKLQLNTEEPARTWC